MTYTEILILVNKYLTNIIDNKLKYYYINYFYICSKYNLLPNNETIEDLLIKVNEYGYRINYFGSDEKEHKEKGNNIKGFVNIEKYKGIINVRNNLSLDVLEKVIYHEIHHIMQINKENNMIGITYGMEYCLINEAETEFVSQFIYNKVHDLEFEKKEYDSEDIYMYTGEKVLAHTNTYQLFDNILTKLCILFDVDKSFFVLLNYNYQNGAKLLKAMFEKKVQEYLNNTRGMRYDFNFRDFLFFINSVFVTFQELYLGHEVIGYTNFFDEYNNLALVSLEFMREAIDYIDLIVFELTLNKDKKREILKYIINKDTKERFINELDNDCKTYTMSRYLQILY